MRGPEDAVKAMLEWEPLEFLAKKFKVKDKKPEHAAVGDFRVIAGRNIVLAAKSIAHVSTTSTSLRGRSVGVTGADDVHVAARNGPFILQAKNIVIGDDVQDAARPKQKPTEWIKVRCQSTLDLSTTNLRAKLDQDTIVLGKRDAAALAVDEAKPRVRIDLAAGAEKVLVGLKSGADELGISVDHAGEVTALASSTFKLGTLQAAAGITLGNSEVAVAGGFKVGTAMLVKGDGVFTITAQAKMALALTRPPLIVTEYAQVILQATTLQQSITGAKASHTAARQARDKAKKRSAREALQPAVTQAKQQIAGFEGQLVPLKAQWQALIAEAALYDMPDSQLNKQPADDNLFP